MNETATMRDALRHILAVLESERQALAGLDLDAIVIAGQDKQRLCGALEQSGNAVAALDEECRAMLESARRQNEVNRQVRNLVAANVEARLDALTGSARLYRAEGYRMIGNAAR